MAKFLSRGRKLVSTVEILGFVSFLLVLRVLSFNPEIAPETERFMDYALLNRIDRTEHFPPADPWMSGEAMNYYYYGYILVSALRQIVAVPLPVFFNLALGLIYALFIMGAFGIGWNLTGKISRGFLAVALLMLIGNLYGFLRVALPRKETADALYHAGVTNAGYFDKVSHQFRNFGFFDGARVMVQTAPDKTILDYPINEFPVFSLLYGDLHPYVITYAINMAVLNLLLNLALASGSGWRSLGETVRERSALLGLLAVLIGMLIGAHTWDYPVYLGAASAILAWQCFRRREPSGEVPLPRRTLPELVRFLPPAAALAVLSFILYLPFNLPFLSAQAAQERGGLGSVGLRTPLDLFLVALGIYLFFAAAYLFTRAVRSVPKLAPLASPPAAAFLVLALGLLVAGGGLWLLPTWLFLLVFLGVPLYFLLAWRLENDEGFFLILVLIAAALAFFCEFFFLIDHYQGGGYERMNTMFKFYTNIWLLLGTAAVFALHRIDSRLRPGKSRSAWRGVSAAFLGAGFIYTWAGTAGLVRAHPREFPETLDGTEYLKIPVPSWQQAEWRWDLPDWEAIGWIEANLPPDAVILQADSNAYDWAPRVATFTGRPTLVGWANHEAGWRNDWTGPGKRARDTVSIYTTSDPTRARTLLNDYGIDYIYVGRTERQKYGAAGLAKFAALGERVYSSQGVEIYRVSRD